MELTEEEYLAHYGTPRKSGRYPWGSGEDGALSRNMSFYDYVRDMEKQGLSEATIAKGLGIKTTELRARKSIGKNEYKQAQISEAEKLRAKGMGNSAIGRQMGIPESTVRTLLAPGVKDRADVLQTTAAMLRQQVADKTWVDVGAGTEHFLNVSDVKLKTAIAVLKDEGYQIHHVKVRQLGTGKDTSQKVLVPPDMTYSETLKNRDKIQTVAAWSEDGGRSYKIPVKPLPIDPKRVGINYKEDGGDQADGVIYVRPGVPDVSLGGNTYAQVRVAVGNGHYLKGMAMYKDDLPAGVDLVFNTNKTNTGNKLDAMKKFERDIDGNVDERNPFGANIRRQILKDDDTPSSVMNLVNEEGSWTNWSNTLSTQMLSKQNPSLAKKQLEKTYEKKIKEFEELSALTNPTVRKKLLETFGDETDSSAVHLEAAGFDRQGWHAILPVNSLPQNHIYAPKFKDGETVTLIRYPHAGTFEIPELTVNNRHPEAKRLLGQAKDAVGIHHSVAERLSGADFDGDTVLVIPNNNKAIKPTAALEGLKNFDPRTRYAPYSGMKTIDGGTYNAATKSVEYPPGKGPSGKNKGLEMGKVSNLITDMTIRKASTEHLARAVRHSMVVIDAEKHSLDYKRSYVENGIAELNERYQNKKSGGASTLISLATAETRVNQRKPRPAAEGGAIDKATGKRVTVETGERHWRTGELLKEKSTKLKETDDAHTLSSGTPIENLYADHSNRLKSLANLARRESVNTPNLKYNPSAAKVYRAEAQALGAKLRIAQRNAPLERQAQVIGNAIYQAKRQANPHLTEADLKKVRYQALNEARSRVQAKKTLVEITPREWEAIQAGAISHSRLRDILTNADIEQVKKLATPREPKLMTAARSTRARAMLSNGSTMAEVAQALGVSVTTLNRSLKGEDDVA